MEIKVSGGLANADTNTVVFEDQEIAVACMWTGAGNSNVVSDISDVAKIDADHPDAAEFGAGLINPSYANPFKGWYGRGSVKFGPDNFDLP